MTAPSRGQCAAIVAVVGVHVLVEDGRSHVGKTLEMVGQAGAEHAAIHWAVYRRHSRELRVELRHVSLVALRGGC